MLLICTVDGVFPSKFLVLNYKLSFLSGTMAKSKNHTNHNQSKCQSGKLYVL